MSNLLCRRLVVLLLLLPVSGWAADPAPEPARAVELTFLKAEPGQREALVQFIESNWFAMDRIAREQGLMDAYSLLVAPEGAADWDVLVAVTYPDERGYAGITEAFERIRAAHAKVLVEGKDLRELGRIVDSRRLLEAASESRR